MRTPRFWLLFAAMSAVYIVMLVWSLPQLRAMAGGLEPFDMRPTGYDLAEAQALIAALGEQGKAFYLGVQRPLDMIYPALYALVLILAFRDLAPGSFGVGLGLLAAFGAGFDYLENIRVAALLRAGPGDLSEAMVEAASNATKTKSLAVALALAALLVLALRASLRRMRK